jgi:hypothetical protein
MRMRLFSSCIVAVLSALSYSSAAEVQSVSKDQEAKWVRWAIPLPKEVRIARKIEIPAEQLAITLGPTASQLERDAATDLAAELAAVPREQTGSDAPVREYKHRDPKFEILLGVCGKDGRLAGREVPGAARLWALPCREQAYRIAPLDDHTLALAGTHPHGVYYAVQTLKQLLSPPGQNRDRTMVTVPLAEVTDWPDIAERGLWGGSANQDIAWLAARKMNLVESHVELSVRDDGRGSAVIPAGPLAEAQRHAVNFVPIITHLEQFPRSVFVRYPELKAVGDEKAWRQMGDIRPVCFSQPAAQQLLSDWLQCLARYPEVTDVNVWLSENEVPCTCPKCKAVNPFVLQTALVLRAWEAAKRIKPGLRLRILLTQGSYRSNGKVLAAVPREVRITYYDGGRTYDASRDPMIYPLMENYARGGRWLGCYPQVNSSWRLNCPWSGPQFIKARMSEFAAKRLQCVCGYAAFSKRFCEFNLTAEAEWSWNAGGRSAREFSLAWATRAGFADPEKAADWAVTLGPVGWDLYGSRVPYLWVYSGVGNLFRQGRPPRLGRDIFRYFPTKEHFDRDLAECQRAMRLAEDLHWPALVEETRVIRGLVETLKGIYLMAEAAAPGKKMTDADRRHAAAALAIADRASREASEALVAWGRAVAPKLVAKGPAAGSMFADEIDCLARVINEAGDIAVTLGIKDAGRPYRWQRVGDWKTDDFKTGAAQQKTWEVSKFVAEPGRYRLRFCYESGFYGTKIKRAAIVSSPANDPALRSEMAFDAHDGATGHHPNDTTYDLELREHDAKRRYFVVADLVGTPPDAPPDRAGCSGYVTMKKLKR